VFPLFLLGVGGEAVDHIYSLGREGDTTQTPCVPGEKKRGASIRSGLGLRRTGISGRHPCLAEEERNPAALVQYRIEGEGEGNSTMADTH